MFLKPEKRRNTLQRTIIIASHHRLAEGMTDTLKYIINSSCSIKYLNGYMSNVSIEKDVQKLMSNVHKQDEVFIFTDILAGSVNQAFMPYMSSHIHLITGMNLPLIMSFILDPNKGYLTDSDIKKHVEEAKKAIIYVNDFKVNDDDDDE